MEKESAAAGLAGLTPWEAARRAMYRKEFQKMPDPLAGVLPDPLAGVKKEDMFMLVSICRTTQSYNNGGSLVEACLFIQRITGNIPSSGLSAKCLLARLQSVI